MVQTMKGLLTRPASLGVRPINFAIEKHLQRDAGCRTTASQYLRSRIYEYRHALVVFDRSGCGDDSSREEIQHVVEQDLAANGWRGRSKVVVIDPELEAWIWNGSNQVPRVLGWQGDHQDLKTWLEAEDLWPSGSTKPPDPKQALRVALRKARKSASSGLFGELARRITLHHCRDPAFAELTGALREWFPPVDV